MSKSFKLVAGDLAIGSGRAFETVSGREKLTQDLTLHILERVGTDPATPTYGSRLDGGIINGQVVPSFIGNIIDTTALQSIRQEVADVVQRYQQYQLQVLRSDVLRYDGASTFEADELIRTVDSVVAQQIGTQVVVRVVITTVAEDQIKLTVPIETQVVGG